MGNYIECDTDLVTKATKEIDDLMTEYGWYQINNVKNNIIDQTYKKLCDEE